MSAAPPKIVMVAGGAGGVGEGIVRALLGAGHTVAAVSRRPERLAALRGYVHGSGPGSLLTVIGDVGEPGGAHDVRGRLVRELGRIDVAIASLGSGWWEGKTLLEMSIGEWDAVTGEMLRTHVVFAQTFIPMLAAQGGGRYIGIGGGAAYHPIPGAAGVCMAAAAQLMMTRALRAELDDPAVDILELVVDGPVHTRELAPVAEPHWISTAAVGAVVADLVEDGRTSAPATTTHGPIVRMRPS